MNNPNQTAEEKELLFNNSSSHTTGKQDHKEPSQFVQQTVELSRRLKLLEERYTNTRGQLQISDQNLIEFEKEIRREMRALNESLLELKKEMRDIHRSFSEIATNMGDVAKKQDLRVIAKYVQMWEPMRFCTEEDVKELIRTYKKA